MYARGMTMRDRGTLAEAVRHRGVDRFISSVTDAVMADGGRGGRSKRCIGEDGLRRPAESVRGRRREVLQQGRLSGHGHLPDGTRDILGCGSKAPKKA